MQGINQLYKLFPAAFSEVISISAVERMSAGAEDLHSRRAQNRLWHGMNFDPYQCLLEILCKLLNHVNFNYIIYEMQMFIEFPNDKYNAWSRDGL